MKRLVKIILHFIFYSGLFFLVSCAPKITFFVTKPPQLPIEKVDSISIGKFTNVMNREISLPVGVKAETYNAANSHSPTVTSFKANQSTADLVRALAVSGLSASGQYQLLNSGGADVVFSGIVPDASKTAIVSAKVKYFEQVFESAETYFFTLIATKGGGTLQEQLVLLAAREASSALVSKSKKGFNVPVPYLEIVSAMEIEFDLIRDSTGQPIVPTQIFRSYFVRKWGGKSERSHVAEPLRKIIVTRYQKDQSVMESFYAQASKIELAVVDPDEFLALGGKLKYSSSVPRNPLEIRTRLAQDIIERFVKRISHHTEETTLEVASGDKTAVTYIKANAYELAINRLENLERSEADSYNLALAYESIAEYRQATVYYQEALDKDPGNHTYQQAISRVSR